MDDREKFLLKNVPSTCYYIPNFISAEEEKLLIHNIEKTSSVRWTQLKNRRLINFGGVPTQKGMIREEIPDFLQAYLDRINEARIFGEQKANHILLNEYRKGQGIMPHFDGPLFHDTITTISVGSHTVLEFHKERLDDGSGEHRVDPEFKLLVEPRSLLILKDDLYHRHMHSIFEVEVDDLTDPLLRNVDVSTLEETLLHRTTRFSLTIRNVPKTSKLKLKFGK